MPELPDVELYRRTLDGHALHRKIVRVVVSDARILGDLAEAEFVARLKGNRLERSRRHGKHLLVQLARDGWLTMHFGMTGEPSRTSSRRTRTCPTTGCGSTSRAAASSTSTGACSAGSVSPTMPTPSSRRKGWGPMRSIRRFDLAALSAALDGRREVKAVLMDQERGRRDRQPLCRRDPVPGAPAPEDAGPRRSARQSARRCSSKIKEVLQTAIDCGAGAEQLLERLPKGYLLPQRHEGGVCPRCGRKLATLKAAGRTSYYCPRCQPEPA